MSISPLVLELGKNLGGMRNHILPSVILLLEAVLLFYLPVMKGPDAFFGVPVTEEFYRSPRARRYLRTYRLVVAALLSGAFVCLLEPPGRELAAPPRVVLAMLAVLLGSIIAMGLIWRQVRSHEARPAQALANNCALGCSPDKWRYVSLWAEVFFWVVVIVLVGLAASQCPKLPPRIPTHWNAAGRADGWAGKNPLGLICLLLMMIYIHVMMLTLLVGMAQVRPAVPAQRADEYLTARERYMRVWVTMASTLRLGVTLLFGGIIWASLFGIEAQARGETSPGMALVWAGTAVVLWAIAWGIIKSLALRKVMRVVAGSGSFERTTPTEKWIGGTLYYNRNDPALWVEKRIGIGWTVNFAHPTAWAITALAIGVPLGVLALALVGATR